MDYIESPTINQIKNFFDLNQKNQKTFRYFKKRGVDALKNHKKTILAFDNNQYIGYGHLDFDSDKTWLGIMVCDDCTGKGIGSKIMKKLLENVVEEIYLTVDKNNALAINLYEKNNFNVINEFESYFLMKRNKL
jgi:ribosomal protein S18 acetylase RimI-like enzyme